MKRRKSRREAFSTKKPPDGFFSVSVGNLAFGGRGKTPTVALVAQILRDAGERVAILSRGYGRRVVEDGVTVVSDGVHLLADLDRAGDEPLMLARALPGVAVLVCDQRAVAGALAQHALGCTAVVLDDGFQHRQMRRDLDLVLVTPDDLTGRRAPLGRLREGPGALARADAVVVEGEGEGEGAEKPSGGFFAEKASRRLFRLFRLHRHTHAPPGLAAGARVFVLAGVAGPARILRAAADAGLHVAGHWTPGDHHRYTRADLARVAREAAAAGAAAVVTTAKDAERLRPFRPLPFDVHVLDHSVTIESSGDGPAFAPWLLERVAATRPQRDSARAHSPTSSHQGPQHEAHP